MDISGLFNSIKDDLLRFIARRVRDVKDAEDIFQDVFLKVVKHADSLKEKEAVRSWIFAIASNQIKDYYRKSKYKVYNNMLDDDKVSIGNEIKSAMAVTLESERCLFALISQLDEKYRYVLIKVVIEGMSQKDLAEEMKIPDSSLRSRVQRGKAKLKGLAEKKCRYNIHYCETLNRLDRKGCSICEGICFETKKLTFSTN